MRPFAHAALARILGMSTDCTQMALARYVHRFADVNGHGEVTRDDLLRFVRDEGLFSDYEDGLRVHARALEAVVVAGLAACVSRSVVDSVGATAC